MNPLRYRGYYYDNETGYYYLQSRYYDPELSRFISADDFNYVDASEKFSINAYAYCANNPVNFSDSTGNTSKLTKFKSFFNFTINIFKFYYNSIFNSLQNLLDNFNNIFNKLVYGIFGINKYTFTVPLLYSRTTVEQDTRPMAIIQGLFGGIVINSFYNAFKAINIDLIDVMNKSIKENWYGLFKELIYSGVAIFTSGFSALKDYVGNANYLIRWF